MGAYFVMRPVMMDVRGPLSEDEVVNFQERPSALLYSLEATRIFIPFLVFLGAVQALLFHAAKGLSIVFLIKLVLTICCLLFPIFFALVMFIALRTTFIVTNRGVVIRISQFGGNVRQLQIPIEDIKSVEVRRYGPRYGSVYFERYKDLYEALPRGSVNVKDDLGRASIWFSLPWGWPPLAGFFGFRNYDAFARLIVDMRAVGGAREERAKDGLPQTMSTFRVMDLDRTNRSSRNTRPYSGR
jgi:hypothetical protein